MGFDPFRGLFGTRGSGRSVDAEDEARRRGIDPSTIGARNIGDPIVNAANENREGAGMLERTVPRASEMRYTPRTFVPALQGTSQAGKAQSDAAAQQAQRQALEGMRSYATGRGTDAIDSAVMRRAIGAAGGKAAMGRATAKAAGAGSGMRGGGRELAQAARANAGAGSDVARAGVNAEADAQQRALSAIQGYGSLGGSMDQQSFNESYARGQANDDVAMQNADTLNEANVYNRNVGVDASLRNATIPDRQFGMRMTAADMKAGAGRAAAAGAQAANDRAYGRVAGIVGGAATGGAALGDYLSSRPDEDDADRKSWMKR